MQVLHSGGLGGHFAQDKTLHLLQEQFFGHEQKEMLQTLCIVVKFVNSTRGNHKTQDYILHYQFQNTHRQISQCADSGFVVVDRF